MKKYAMVIDNVFTEYPVTEDLILQRGHPLAWYKPVVDVHVEAAAGVRQDVEEARLVVEGSVVTRYLTWRAYTLEELLRRFVNDGGEVVSIADIPMADIEYAKQLVSDHFEDKLEMRAKALGYQSLNNLLGRYSNSSIPSFKAEAQVFQTKLDAVWAELLTYFGKLSTGELPVPTTVAEIEAEVHTLDSFDETPSTPATED